MFKTEDMLKVFAKYRGDAVVIPGRGGRHWVNISTKPDRDVPLGDPAMGGHASFGLGLALSRPKEKVILFDSEGDVLMNLGVLPTIAEKDPKNFYHFLLDNECYATTGGQPVPTAEYRRNRQRHWRIRPDHRRPRRYRPGNQAGLRLGKAGGTGRCDRRVSLVYCLVNSV